MPKGAMVSKYMVSIIVKRDDSVAYAVHDAWGRPVCGGDTSLERNAPKDPIRSAFRSAEGMLRAQIVGRKKKYGKAEKR